MSTNSLFTASTSCPRTEPLTDTAAAMKLRTSAYTERYTECGYHCITGFDEDHRVTVMIHANSAAEIDAALNPDAAFRRSRYG